MHKSLTVSFDHDREVNAAAITFEPVFAERDLRQYAIEDADGSTIATVTFDAAGRLLQIELLDAAAQLPEALRGIVEESEN